MAEEITVRMDLCAKVPGKREYKCVDDGFTAKYRKGQVGPHEVTVKYPSA